MADDLVFSIDQKWMDPSLGTLARSGVALDMETISSLGGLESCNRYRQSLVAFDSATQQTNVDIATILFVTGIESLIYPAGSWGRERVVARFINMVLEYASDAVDEICAHQNTPGAFGLTFRGGAARRRKDLLERIYDLRSGPVHGALNPAAGFMGSSGDIHQMMRIALLSDLHRQMILAFLEAPRSSLVGYPALSVSDAVTGEYGCA